MLIQRCKQSYLFSHLDQHDLYDVMVPDFLGIFHFNQAFISTQITYLNQDIHFLHAF